MPRVIVQALEGRTLSQRRELCRGLTEAVVAAFGVPADSVTIVVQEMEPDNYAKGGVLELDRAANQDADEPFGGASS